MREDTLRERYVIGGAQLVKMTFFAPASRAIRTISRLVVPRTMLSSTSRTFFPSNFLRIGFNLARTPFCRAFWFGMMKVRKM